MSFLIYCHNFNIQCSRKSDVLSSSLIPFCYHFSKMWLPEWSPVLWMWTDRSMVLLWSILYGHWISVNVAQDNFDFFFFLKHNYIRVLSHTGAWHLLKHFMYQLLTIPALSRTGTFDFFKLNYRAWLISHEISSC